MVIVQWRESSETGVEEMDNEHKALIDIINQLYEILREKRPQEELRQIYGKLLDYAKNHFSHEEDLLRRSNYAAFAEQCRAHAEFIEKLKGLQGELLGAKETAAVEVYTFLRQWWLYHIVGEDKRYGPHLMRYEKKILEDLK